MENTELLNAVQQMFDSLKSDIQRVEQKVDGMESLKFDVQRVEEKVDGMESLKSDVQRVEEKVDGINILLETEIRRDIQLLAEGHEMLLERLPDPEAAEAVDARLFALEAVVRKNSKDIKELRKAQ